MTPNDFSKLLKYRWFCLSGVGAILALALAFSSAPAEAAPRCGAPGKPACPFQEFMRARLAAAFAKRDFAELERRLLEVAEKNPEPKQWHNWNKFAKDGAKAAREKRLSGVVAACARCHGIYRPEFNAKYRQRIVME